MDAGFGVGGFGGGGGDDGGFAAEHYADGAATVVLQPKYCL